MQRWWRKIGICWLVLYGLSWVLLMGPLLFPNSQQASYGPTHGYLFAFMIWGYFGVCYFPLFISGMVGWLIFQKTERVMQGEPIPRLGNLIACAFSQALRQGLPLLLVGIIGILVYSFVAGVTLEWVNEEYPFPGRIVIQGVLNLLIWQTAVFLWGIAGLFLSRSGILYLSWICTCSLAPIVFTYYSDHWFWFLNILRNIEFDCWVVGLLSLLIFAASTRFWDRLPAKVVYGTVLLPMLFLQYFVLDGTNAIPLFLSRLNPLHQALTSNSYTFLSTPFDSEWNFGSTWTTDPSPNFDRSFIIFQQAQSHTLIGDWLLLGQVILFNAILIGAQYALFLWLIREKGNRPNQS